MDASASRLSDTAINNAFNFFKKLEYCNYSIPPKHNTVTKYTKLPDFDFDSRATWSRHSYTLKPGLRRIIQMDDDNLLNTSRSFKIIMPPPPPPKIVAPSYSRPKRVMVTISEENENDQHPKFSKDKKQYSMKLLNKSVEVDLKIKQSQDKSPNSPSRLSRDKSPNSPSRLSNSLNNPSSRLTNHPKLSKEIRSAKTSRTYFRKELTVAEQSYRSILPRSPPTPVERSKIEMVKEKETLRSSRNLNPTTKTKESKNIVIPSHKEISKIQNIVNNNNMKTYSGTYRKTVEKSHTNKLPLLQSKLLRETFKEDIHKKKPLTIHVPLSEHSLHTTKESNPHRQSVKHTADCASETEDVVQYNNANVATDLVSKSISQMTEIQDFERKAITTCESGNQTDSMDIQFDSLEIPNVTLTKDKSEPKEEDPTILNTTALPNLEVPPVKIVPQTEEVSSSDGGICQSASYVIRQGSRQKLSVTYTTRQKINFHVLGKRDDDGYSLPPSPIDYPMNVVSVFKNELKIKKTNENDSSDHLTKKKNTPKEDHLNHLNDLKSLDCSYVYNKLMKPSDIISTIRVNNGLLQSDICEQFQRELNFIDSFFESLQYLETFSLTDKGHTEDKIENFTNNSVLFDAKNSEYNNFLSKLENGANIDDTETMASKSLCLLNLLIRDEQRRAKNLLFVLKMREDALKDFTKSQILWLEKKKKHDNTDISTLKKKQRGALLKLQHECGEMQRMRKALLTLSEKRKVALMKTLKNIELKLKNNGDVVEQIIFGKKKLKRSTGFDRNAVPLKCFDLSSSGCEENSTAKATSDASMLLAEECTPQCKVVELRDVTRVEKCVQTSYCASDHATNTAAENFIVVDGGYLNILFHNLTLPQIFSSGKHYEVNEEALKNIVNSANSHNTNLSGSKVAEKLMDQIKNKDGETSSTSPSTARSLIDEFDQYYKDLNEVDKSFPTIPENHESKDSSSQTDIEYERPTKTSSVMPINASTNNIISLSNEAELCVCKATAPLESEGTIDKEPVTTSQAPNGPLPVPVGAAAVVDSQLPEVESWVLSKTTSPSSSEATTATSVSLWVTSSVTSASAPLVSAPAHVEAEELRRQQLAIEREIKALEQQQSRLLVVREIPDKPPPPYTPPTETRTPKPSSMFSPDEYLEENVAKHIINPQESTCESTEPYVVFVQDYCQESLKRHKQELSDMPWDACNLLPPKPPVDVQELIEKTSAELKDVLTCLTPTAGSVSSRRSDHIDDILFTEWWRCEPEWTALHSDEATVKNQIFESIFQKILTDTIDEYKKTVMYEGVRRGEN